MSKLRDKIVSAVRHAAEIEQQAQEAADLVMEIVQPLADEIDQLRQQFKVQIGLHRDAEREVAALEAELVAVRSQLDKVRSVAAEAHRRKWQYEEVSPGTFAELDRIGNQLLAALDEPEGR